jgi:hypothetical protein
MDAGTAHQLCELVDTTGRTRLVEPYMVYQSSRGKNLFHCYQTGGYSKSGRVIGWKNPEVASFVRASIHNEPFVPRVEYNPFNLEMFPVVYFSLPTREGRTRQGFPRSMQAS